MKKIITRKQCFTLFLVVCFNFGIYYSARIIANSFYHYSFTTTFDSKIPFIPWMIFNYWACYLFWAIDYTISMKYEKGKTNQFITSHFIGETICFICFILLPTTMVRPTITGNSFPELLLKLTYFFDPPDNLFPSIHCFASWLSWIGVRKNQYIPKWYQYISLGIAILICITTLTVRQHVLADVISGILLAEFSYFVSGRIININKKKVTTEL